MRRLRITSSITNRDTTSVEIYFHEIAKLKTISAEEEVILARKIRQGDHTALERLTRANLRFVVSIAKKYQYQGLPLGDLISEGNIGLVKAAKLFDETKGFKFISFAVWWIRQSILAAIAEHTRMIRLPRNNINLLTKINHTASQLESQLERCPTNEELAEFIGIVTDKITEVRNYSSRTSSYDISVSHESDFPLIEMLGNGEQTMEEILMLESEKQNIIFLLETLTPREQTVIKLSFGLNGEQEKVPAEIGPLVNLSTERVRQIRNEALRKLKGVKYQI